MKISDAVARALIGDNIVTGRDEKGLYVNYDSIRFVLSAPNELEFYFKGQCVGSLPINTTLREGDHVELRNLEGRIRIDLQT